MSPTLQAFSDEVAKIAAWTDADKKELKGHLRQQAKFDQMSAKPGMTDAQRQLHKDNTVRVKEFLKKKRGDIKTVPGWVRDPGGAPPKSTYQASRGPRRGPSIPKGMMRKLKIVGGVAAGLTAANLGSAAYTDYKRWKENKGSKAA